MKLSNGYGILGESHFRHLAPKSSAEAFVDGRGRRGFGSAGRGEPGDYMLYRVRGKVINGLVCVVVTAAQRTDAGSGHGCRTGVSLGFV